MEKKIVSSFGHKVWNIYTSHQRNTENAAVTVRYAIKSRKLRKAVVF